MSAALIGGLLLARGGPLPVLAGIAYAAGTLAAFFASVYAGLFRFVEALNGTPQMTAALAEASTFMLLLLSLAYERASPTRLAVKEHQ